MTQTTRAVDHNTRVPMVGFPQHRLETYLTMLTERGYDIEVNALEDGKRITCTVVSSTKEAPIESKPIGRIDYLGTDGKVGESIEYTSLYSFEKDMARTARSVKASSTPVLISLRRTSRRKTTTVCR